MSIKENMNKVLGALAKAKRDEMGNAWVDGPWLQTETGLSPADLNDAIDILNRQGLVQFILWLGTAPYIFGQVQITPQGRYSIQ